MSEKTKLIFDVGEKHVTDVQATSCSFVNFVDQVKRAQLLTPVGESIDKPLRRLRMLELVTYFNGPSVVKLTEADILNLPVMAGVQISEIAESIDYGEGGKLVKEGNGVDEAMVFELGSPISMGKDKEPIARLEFLADTYADVEDVLAANGGLEQALAMLKHVAKPIHKTLQTIPDAALSRISIADGLAVSTKVVPNFLG